jgi:UDP:flavonoid glycosyltransferase YjiC (YdhE family)
LTGEGVKLAVNKVIADIDMQKNLQHFKEILTKTNGPKSAVDEISTFLGGQEDERDHADIVNWTTP